MHTHARASAQIHCSFFFLLNVFYLLQKWGTGCDMRWRGSNSIADSIRVACTNSMTAAVRNTYVVCDELIASVKRYPRTILSTPGTSGYDISYEGTQSSTPQTSQIVYLLTEVMSYY